VARVWLYSCLTSFYFFNNPFFSNPKTFCSDSEFDAAEAARNIEQSKRQKLWDQLVHAVSKAVQRGKDEVNLSRMNITKLPEVMKKGSDLFVSLNLSENLLKQIEVTSPLLTLKCLTKLFLMDNSLLTLPDMTCLSSLVLLDVDGNDLGRGMRFFVVCVLLMVF